MLGQGCAASCVDRAMSKLKTRLWIAVLPVFLGLGGVGVAILVQRQPETTPAMRGKFIAQELGCFACHGPEGTGGVADPTSPGGVVPDWRYATVKMFVTSEHDIREWILYGAPRSESAGTANDDFPTLVPMPAYEDCLSAEELDDLVAYFLAVSGWRSAIPDDAFEGRKIATRLGCFGCHGPSGMGGVANPRSLKGHIPPWDGVEFTELVRDEQELRDWILYGKIDRLWTNRAARFFLNRQKTPMPPYHDHISDDELDKLVAYIRFVRTAPEEAGQRQREATTVIGSIAGAP